MALLADVTWRSPNCGAGLIHCETRTELAACNGAATVAQASLIRLNVRKFFAPNLNGKGRVVRGLMGVALLGAAVFAYHTSLWLALVLAVAGAFGLFEAFRGWCAARACGIKTKF